jgi:4-hydroxybenzoate polyprenyltransferase
VTAPRSSRLGRLADYLVALFPPWSHVPLGLGLFGWVHFALQASAGHPVLTVTPRFWAGAATVVLFTLLLRVYDELKDADHDIGLARAGDTRYTRRPIVTGHVTIPDLVALRWAITVALIGLNVWMGLSVLVAFSAVFAWTWLSFRWFFWPKMSKNLLAAFATHNPMVLATTVYTMVVFSSELGALPGWPILLCLLVASWMPFAAWEIARKLRLPEDETDYQTYSKMFGVRAAAVLPTLFVVAATAALVPIAAASRLGRGYLLVLLVATVAVVGASARLVLAPSRRATRMQPIAELYLSIVALGFPIAAAISHGVSWS